jgi:hypothetical protein
MPELHLKYGGSTMARTVNCHAWTRLSERIQKSAVNGAANRGSFLHDIAETCILAQNIPASDFVGHYSEKWDYLISEEDAAEVETALNAASRLFNEYGIKDYVTEEFVQINDLIGGSADVIAWGDTHAIILDWKFGFNEVSPIQSWQGATYALSALYSDTIGDKLEGKKILFAIIQPKVSDTAQVYEFTDRELDEMEDRIIEAVNIHESGGGEAIPGDWCQFCPAGPVCPSKIMQAQAAVRLPKDVSMDLETALALAEQLEPWVREVKKFAHEMLEQGAEIPGWKLVAKRAMRAWADEEQTLARLKAMRKVKLEDYCDIKLKSAPQIEKLCKTKKIDFQKEFSDLVETKSSGTTLAPADDKRPAVSALLTQGEVTAALSKIA